MMITLAACCAAFFAAGQQPFIVEGHVPLLPDSTRIDLYKTDGRSGQRVATAYITNGTFSLSYPVEALTTLAVSSDSERIPRTSLSLWGLPGVTATVTAPDHHIYTWLVESPVPEQQEYARFTQPIKPLLDEYYQVGMGRNQLFDEMMQATTQEEEQAIQDRIREIDAKRNSILPVIYEKQLVLMADAVPSSASMGLLWNISAMLDRDGYTHLMEPAVAQYERPAPEQKLSPRGREIALALFPPTRVKIGDRMAEAELPDLSGTPHKL